jgi:hypothetical protein
MVWNYITDAASWGKNQALTTFGNIKDSSIQTYDIARGNDDEFNDISRRQLIESTGALFAGLQGAKKIDDGAEYALENSPVGFRSPIVKKDGDLDSANQELEPTDDSPNSDGSDSVNDGGQNYSEEICSAHSKLEEDIQDDIESFLESMHEDDEVNLEDMEVTGDYEIKPPGFDPLSITGEEGGEGEFGATQEYADTLRNAYTSEEEEFYDGLNKILEGNC